MNKFAVAGAVAALAVATAGSASAAVMFSFTSGAATPDPNYVVIDQFNNLTGVTGSGFVLSSTTNSSGAQPDETPQPPVPYLDVMGGGTALITFSALTSLPVTSFEFDWGSVDTFNHLTIHSSAGDVTITPPNPGNGSWTSANTNGLFKVWGTAGETFSGITLSTDMNSFEIDNLAVHGVPEPASWAMMIVGFGAIGFAMRRRNQAFSAA
jgi:hypothetical protein